MGKKVRPYLEVERVSLHHVDYVDAHSGPLASVADPEVEPDVVSNRI